MQRPISSPCSFTTSTIFKSISSISAITAVSSAYLKLLMFSHSVVRPGIYSVALNTGSVYIESLFGDSTHPCLTPLLILDSFELPFCSHTTTLCSQLSSSSTLLYKNPNWTQGATKSFHSFLFAASFSNSINSVVTSVFSKSFLIIVHHVVTDLPGSLSVGLKYSSRDNVNV